MSVEAIRGELPEPAKDIKLNLQTVLQDGSLSEDQRWGVAVACAIATRSSRLREAVALDASDRVAPEVLDDAKAAAVLMGMNNVYYRFRHVIGKEEYARKPARLRMNRIAKPATNKTDFELMCLAVSAMNGCEACVRSHEKVVIEGGLTEDHVNDAVRIAATMQAAAIGLEV